MSPKHCELTFEEDAIDRLARIEERIAGVAELGLRVTALERHRNYLAGFLACMSALCALAFHILGLPRSY